MFLRLTAFAALIVLGSTSASTEALEEQAAFQSQAPGKTLVDCSSHELNALVAGSAGTFQPDEDQTPLPTLLSQIGIRIEEFMKNFPNTTCTETIRQERVEPGGSVEKRSRKCRYVIVGYPNMVMMDEYRTDNKGSAIKNAAQEGPFLLTSGYAVLPLLLHPAHQPGSRFRYVGTMSDPDRLLIAFAQVPFRTKLQQQFTVLSGVQATIFYQGLIWVDPASYQIIRMHTELLEPATQVGVQNLSADLDFGPIAFDGSNQAFWLPREVNVTTQYLHWKYRNRHLYDGYKRFSVESFDKVKAPGQTGPGTPNREHE